MKSVKRTGDFNKQTAGLQMQLLLVMHQTFIHLYTSYIPANMFYKFLSSKLINNILISLNTMSCRVCIDLVKYSLENKNTVVQLEICF